MDTDFTGGNRGNGGAGRWWQKICAACANFESSTDKHMNRSTYMFMCGMRTECVQAANTWMNTDFNEEKGKGKLTQRRKGAEAQRNFK